MKNHKKKVENKSHAVQDDYFLKTEIKPKARL